MWDVSFLLRTYCCFRCSIYFFLVQLSEKTQFFPTISDVHPWRGWRCSSMMLRSGRNLQTIMLSQWTSPVVLGAFFIYPECDCVHALKICNITWYQVIFALGVTLYEMLFRLLIVIRMYLSIVSSGLAEIFRWSSGLCRRQSEALYMCSLTCCGFISEIFSGQNIPEGTSTFWKIHHWSFTSLYSPEDPPRYCRSGNAGATHGATGISGIMILLKTVCSTPRSFEMVFHSSFPVGRSYHEYLKLSASVPWLPWSTLSWTLSPKLTNFQR